MIDSLFSSLVKRFKKHFFELLVIFLSIMLAFFTDNWRENRQDIRQDHEDFNLIIQEINYNLRLDSIELAIDVGDIKKQVEYLELLINLGQTFKKDSLRFNPLKVHFLLTLNIERLQPNLNLLG